MNDLSVNSNFNEFVNNNVNWREEFEIYQKDDSRYQRITIKWSEELRDKSLTLAHEYHSSIDLQTGDIYLDCSRRKIFVKHWTLVFARPLHTVVKTAWHVSVVGPLALELFKLAKGKQTLQEFGIHMIQSMADVVRTPLYGLAMTITHLAGGILGGCSPNTLYRTRQAAGLLERRLLRTEKVHHDPWVLTPCFSPLKNIGNIWNKQQAPSVKKTQLGLIRFAKGTLAFRRENRTPFNDCCFLFPANEGYVSAVKRRL